MKKILNPENIQDILALTPMQEGMLLNYLKNPNSDQYFVQLCIDFSGKVELEYFQKAWDMVIAANEMLRVVFQWEKINNPVQIVLKNHRNRINYFDISDLRPEQQHDKLKNIKSQDRKNGFDLTRVPLRLILCKINENNYEIILSSHHILYDGWSNGIIIEELLTHYSELSHGHDPGISPKVSFKEFIKWLQRGDKTRQQEFWSHYLSGFDAQHDLALKQHKKSDTRITARIQTKPAISLVDELKLCSTANNVSLAALFYAATGLSLQQYNNTDDVIFGTTVAGRPAKIMGIESVVGLFINTLPLRVKTTGYEKISEILTRVNDDIISRMEVEHTPLVDIKTCSALDKNEELFDVLVIIENYPLSIEDIQNKSGITIHSYASVESIYYDLTIVIKLFKTIDIDFFYNANRLQKESVEKFAAQYIRWLEWIVTNTSTELRLLEVIDANEKKRILADFNDTKDDYPKELTVHKLFEEQVTHSAHQVATVFKDEHLSYEELNRKANQLARLLIAKGIKQSSVVGLFVDRSNEMIIGKIAIMKAGAAYLPISRDCPPKRMAFMLADSCAEILLTDHPMPRNSYPVREIIYFDALKACEFDDSDLAINISSTDLAYITYTSGTTGKPKGVMIEHAAFVNFIFGMRKIVEINKNDNILSLTTISFDIVGLETILPLTVGAKVIIGGKIERQDPQASSEIIQKEHITIFQTTPSWIATFLVDEAIAECLHQLKVLLIGGEIFPESLLPKLQRCVQGTILNMYGPTETTIWSTVKDLTHAREITIGTPISNTDVYILDTFDRLQLVGIPGELCIGGDGVARGYLNQPGLTDQKFFTSQVGTKQRLYRTGDLARWLPNGEIEFIGRVDHQVKIRGFRIELSEIERSLMDFEGIDEAIVTVVGHNDQQSELNSESAFLCAYIKAEKEISIPLLKEFLIQRLPDYMLPVHFVFVENFKLTLSGKVDRKALPTHKPFYDSQNQHDTKPQNETEQKIAAIWKELLLGGMVGVERNFFDVGGNSLLLIRLNSRINKVFETNIPILKLFDFTTIRSMAQYVDQIKTDKTNELYSHEHKNFTIHHAEPGIEDDEIAVIGIACRFPGAKSWIEFWDNLKNGIESISFAGDDNVPNAAMNNNNDFIRAKGRLDDIDYFDPSFFGFTKRESELMDPQTRILHEVVWEALEDSAYNPEKYDSAIGLYVGASANPYYEAKPLFLGNKTFTELWSAYQYTSRDFLATRIAYSLNLKGPAITLQTACSTSLVAVDLACQELIRHKCDIALAGGISITFHDEAGYQYQENMILSRDGHCRAFDADASGTVSGNGAGVVVLKLLKKAISDGDHIYAVIKSSATNNDGSHKVGFTAPGIAGQVNVIKAALKKGHIQPESISYIETHGTGTVLGDPVEIEALNQAFDIQLRNCCAIGSVKTNIGHLDAAAGIAGFIKTALALHHRFIPPSLHFQKPNPKIDFENSPFYVNEHLTEWRTNGSKRRAGVSSFGIGGTNAHVILEEAPTIAESEINRSSYLLILSALSETALNQARNNYFDFLKNNPRVSLPDVAYTLQIGRKNFDYRWFSVVCSHDEAIKKFAEDTGIKNSELMHRPVIFLFPGQGSHYANMGRSLYEQEPLFQREIDHCFSILKAQANREFKKYLYPEKVTEALENELTRTDINQPVLFVFEYALAKLLMKIGIKPFALIGHSLGEYVAACIAGAVSLEDALKLVTTRGKLMQRLERGSMLSVALSEDELRPLLPGNISLAAVNSSKFCVVSGLDDDIHTFSKMLKKSGYACKRLNTSHAFHSAMMESMLDDYEKEISNVRFNSPELRYVSNLSGTWITNDEISNPQYWINHIREPVRFAHGLTTLFTIKNALFLEVGPGNVLTTFIKNHNNREDEHLAYHIMPRPHNARFEYVHFLNTLGEIWAAGSNIDWQPFYENEKRQRLSLPTYPFERQHIPRSPIDWQFAAGIHTAGAVKEKKQNAEHCFFMPSWKQVPNLRTTGSIEDSRATWLFFVDESEISRQLIANFKNEVNRTILVQLGDCFERLEGDTYKINPSLKSDFEELVNHLSTKNIIPGKIVYLWSIPGKLANHFDDKQYEIFREPGFYSLLYLAQALKTQDVQHKLDIYVITSDLFRITGLEIINPLTAIVLGPVRTIPLEVPGCRCRLIDLSLSTGVNGQWNWFAQQLKQEFTLDSTEPITAYRYPFRWLPLTDKIKLEKPVPAMGRIKENGVYLITGGLGELGRAIARSIAERVKATLILINRSGLPGKELWQDRVFNPEINEKIQFVFELEELGANVYTSQVDVTNKDELHRYIQEIQDQTGPIDGIIHAAGLPDGVLLERRTKDNTDRILDTKIRGLIALYEIFKNQSLDFFVLFSSINTIVAQPGQMGYCSANAVLDLFAHASCQEKTFPVMTINWDRWQGRGMAKMAEELYRNKTHHELPGGIEPTHALEAFHRILDCFVPQIIVSNYSIEELIAQSKLIIEMFTESSMTVKQAKKAIARPRPRLSQPFTEPGTTEEKLVAQIWHHFFDYEPIGLHDDFFELGGDSLKALNLISQVQSQFNVKLNFEIFFKNPTISGISKYIQCNKPQFELKIPRAEKKSYYKIAPMQKRFYLLHAINDQDKLCHETRILKINGEIDVNLLQEAFEKVIARHEILRTSFETIHNEPVQRIHKNIAFSLKQFQARTIKDGLSPEEVWEIAPGLWESFDLRVPPLIRAGLIYMNDKNCLLILVVHHIITDQFSQAILAKELMDYYFGNPLEPMILQYKDYSEWSYSKTQRKNLLQQRAYWLEQLDNKTASLNLSLDYPRPDIKSYEGKQYSFRLGQERTKRIKEMAGQNGVTIQILLLSIFKILLSIKTGTDDVVVGTTIAGRQHLELNGNIGLFANMLAIRSYPRPGKTFLEYLQEVKTISLQAYAHQDYPFEDLVNDLMKQRDMSRNPVFDIMFEIVKDDYQLFENISNKAKNQQLKFTIEPYAVEQKNALFDQDWIGFEREENIYFNIVYGSVLFDELTIELMTREYCVLIDNILDHPGSRIEDIDCSLLAESEIQAYDEIKFNFYPK